MLASPLMPGTASTAVTFNPSHPSDDALQFRPARDLDAFNKLLPPPIEFVEGSSSGTLAVAEGKYEPINASPKSQKLELSGQHSTHHSVPNGPPDPTSAKGASTTSLFHGGIDTSWPGIRDRGVGLNNTGNTCFLNSALQCLLHTPPLLRVLFAHKDHCGVEKGFCMSCALRTVAVKAYNSSHAFTPITITDRLQSASQFNVFLDFFRALLSAIAKHMRRGRQEDSHEFLRYAIDALQKSCLAGYPPKLDPKLTETTWVHKIFAGRLRSRVTCHDCGYNSDTFDRVLDLSLDILRSESLKDALRKFVAIDYLKGADKYKCEKCKMAVVAEKRFTIHEAPVVLTVHLKRFSPMGRKISHYIDYDEHLSLQPYMSEGKHGPTYSLYGVICHAGGGPNSGHYFAYIKSKEGRWWEMNDELVTPIGGAAVNKKSAYILFYMRNKGQGLEAAVKASSPSPRSLVPSTQKTGLAAAMKKKKEREPEGEDEDTGEKVPQPFIGPVIPDSLRDQGTASEEKQKEEPANMQAIFRKKKQEADRLVKEKAAGLLASLDTYGSDDEGSNDTQSTKESKEKVEPLPEKAPPSSPSCPLPSDSRVVSEKKRKYPDSDGENSASSPKIKHETHRGVVIASRTPSYRSFKSGTNPFNHISKQYGRSRLRGI